MIGFLKKLFDPAFWGFGDHQVLKPGELAPASGQYEIIGIQGIPTGKERTVTKGSPLPPVEKSGQTYRLVDRTENEAGEGG